VSARPAVAVLGAGRAGCSLHAALESVGRPAALLWTRSPATAAAARSEGFPAVSGELPDPAACELVVLAVTDSALGEVAAALARAPGAGRIALHLSGAHDLSVLAPAPVAGWSTGSLHPLASLATRRSPLAGHAAAVEASDPRTQSVIEDLAGALGLSVIRPTGSRARYHAAACMAGTYPQVLLEAAVRMLQDCGLAPEEARRALVPLMESAVRNAREHGGAAGLTGPVARGDAAVVAAHLDSFGPGDSRLAALYRAAGRVAVGLARESNARKADEVARLLGDGGP